MRPVAIPSCPGPAPQRIPQRGGAFSPQLQIIKGRLALLCDCNIQMQYGWKRAEQEQEQHIEQIHQLAARMKVAGRDIGEELHRQEGLIAACHHQMMVTEGRLGDLQKEVGELLETQDINQVCTCLMLCCFMIVLIILVVFV